MSKFWIINLFDKLFVGITIFLITFAWINFYLRDLWISFVVGLVFAFSLSFILFSLFEKRKNKNLSRKTYIEEVDKNYLAFQLSSLSDKIDLMSKIISVKNEVISKNKVLIYKCNGLLNLMLFPKKTTISQNDLIEILSNENLKGIDVVNIVCEKSNNLNLKILNNVTINIIDKIKLFDNYFSYHKIFPNTSFINQKSTMFDLKSAIFTMFDSNHTKPYFFCGLILIFSSLIIPYQPYYIVVGSMLLLFSLISKILPKFKK